MAKCPKCQKVCQQASINKYGSCASCKPAESKKKSIPKALKEAVWRKYFANQIDGNCPICNKIISLTAHDCGHIVAESKGGVTEIENLRPVCKSCNTSMATKDMDEFKRMFMKFEDMEICVSKIRENYLLMWDEVKSLYTRYLNDSFTDEEEKLGEERPELQVYGWLEITGIYAVIIDLLLHNADHKFLLNEVTKYFIDPMKDHSSLQTLVHDVSLKMNLHVFHQLKSTQDWKVQYDQLFEEMDKKYFKFQEIKDLKDKKQMLSRIIQKMGKAKNSIASALKDYEKIRSVFTDYIRFLKNINEISQTHCDKAIALIQTAFHLIKLISPEFSFMRMEGDDELILANLDKEFIDIFKVIYAAHNGIGFPVIKTEIAMFLELFDLEKTFCLPDLCQLLKISKSFTTIVLPSHTVK